MLTGAVARWRLPVPARSPASLRATVSEILAQRQFHPGPGLVQRFFNWLHAHLHLPSVKLPSAYGGAWESYVVLAVLLGAVVAALVAAARRGFFRRLAHPAASPGVVVTDEGEAFGPAAWRARAERLAAEGRFREALRCRYCALVGELARRGLLDEVPGRTSGDYEKLVSTLLPGVAQQFASVTAQFERCWYGDEPSDANEQVLFDEAARLVVREVDAGRWQASSHQGRAPVPAGGAR
jgi:hypothetical protein